MYNGIGLTTPRGSGTNGHVQRNWALVRPREKDRSYRTEDELAALDTAANKQPNKEILDHERKRKIELKCAEFADILEEQGYSEGAITNKVNNYRNMLLNHDGKLDKAVDQWGRPSVTETHQVAEAQQEKNAKLREAFGISEYFVDGSSFDPDREAKEQVARSNALLERERQQQVDKAQAQRYDLVQTPSPEPEAQQQPDVEAERKKSKKRKHKDSTSSEEASSSKKKKKSKKRNKKERSEKCRDKKAKKKRKRSSKASSDDSDGTGRSSNDDTTSDEERKRRKRKKKEKKKLKKKRASSKSSSSRDSSPEARAQKPSPKSKEPDKNDSKSSSSKIDHHRRDSHDDGNPRRHSHSPPAHRGRDRRSRSKERESNYRGYNARNRRSPKEKPQCSPKRTDRYKTKYEQTGKNARDQSHPRHTRSRSLSSEHGRRTRSGKRNNDDRQRVSRSSRDKRSRSRSLRMSKRNDSRYSPVHRSRSKSIGGRSSSVENRKKMRNRSKSPAENVVAKLYPKRSRSHSVERPSVHKSRRSDSKSPEVVRLRYRAPKEGRRSISRDERIDDSTKRSGRAIRVSPKRQNDRSIRDRSASLEITSRRSNTSSPRNKAYFYRPSASQERHKPAKLSSRHRSKSVEKRQEYSRSSSMKIRRQESSSPCANKKRSPSPKQSQSKKSAAEEYSESHGKKGSEETVIARSWHGKAGTRNRSISSEGRLRSKDCKSDKHLPDRYSPRDVSTSPERKGPYKNEEQKKKDSTAQVLSKIHDDASHKAMDSRKRKSISNRTSARDKSSSPDGKYRSRTETLKQKALMEEVLLKINDDRTQRVAVTESMLSKSFKDRSRSPDSKSSKGFDYDKQKSLMEEVLSKINANKSTYRDVKQSSSQTERFNKYRTPSPDPKSIRNNEAIKQKMLMEEVVSKINDISKSARSTTPPRTSRNSESEKHKKTPKSTTKTREQKPVVCLRATSDDENSNSGNEHEENAELIENEMRVLRMLKSDLAAKAKESLERKRVSKKLTPSPKKAIDPNTFDIQGPPGIEKREAAILEKVSAQLFPTYENLVKETRKCSVRDSSSKSPMKKSKDKEHRSRSPSDESRSRSRKSSKSAERKSRSRSKTKRKSRKSVSSSSASSYSSGHRSSSSSSSSSDSSRSSRSRSRSSSGSRSSSTSSRSRSPSIPRRHGSPSFLDRRRITSARKRPIPYHRASPSTSPSSSVSSYSSASPWFQRNRNNNAPTAALASRSASVDSFRSPVGSPPHVLL